MAAARSEKRRPIHCTHRLDSEHGMLVATFGCRGCGAEGDLRSGTCFSNVLTAFVNEIQIDSVVLADLYHRQYSGGMVAVLRAQAELVRASERAATRAGAAVGEKSSACGACSRSPARTFTPLALAARRTIPALVEAAEAARASAAAAPPEHHPQCGGCVAQTAEAARHLAEKAVEARALVGRVAYQVEAAE